MIGIVTLVACASGPLLAPGIVALVYELETSKETVSSPPGASGP